MFLRTKPKGTRVHSVLYLPVLPLFAIFSSSFPHGIKEQQLGLRLNCKAAVVPCRICVFPVSLFGKKSVSTTVVQPVYPSIGHRLRWRVVFVFFFLNFSPHVHLLTLYHVADKNKTKNQTISSLRVTPTFPLGLHLAGMHGWKHVCMYDAYACLRFPMLFWCSLPFHPSIFFLFSFLSPKSI